MKENKKVTEKEYVENLGFMSDEDHKKRLEAYQKATDNKYKMRDYIQSNIQVCNKGCREHIWVWVVSVNEKEKTITGKISNDPLHEDAIVKHGQSITVSFDEIEAIIPHTYNVTDN